MINAFQYSMNMKKLFLGCCGFLLAMQLSAQAPTVKQLQESAMALMQQGDFSNAMVALEKAKAQEPQNLEVLKNISFCYFLQREFAQAIDAGKIAIEHPNADQQSFQILGMSYKSIADYAAANKIYKRALKKFPDGGVIYSEYGESLMQENKKEEAIAAWEKGIELAPSYSGNYYHAAKYYYKEMNWIRVLIHGELFVNLESYSTRTEDVKKALWDAYRNVLRPIVKTPYHLVPKYSVFEQKQLAIYEKTRPMVADGLTIDHIGSIRTRLLTEWMTENATAFPYQLFQHWQHMIREDIFEAYNQWLFGAVYDADAYKKWQETHAEEANKFKEFQQSRVYRQPGGQYYLN